MTDGTEVHDPEFTPNPDRAVWVEGQLNEALLDRLRPGILELTAQNRDPITVFINSSGGSLEVSEGILSLLRRTTQDDSRASRIITVAAPKAKSAAANLLSAGDFAIAYPECMLLCGKFSMVRTRRTWRRACVSNLFSVNSTGHFTWLYQLWRWR